MAARRQPAPAAATTPAGLKIKVKTGVGAVKPGKGSQPQEIGEDIGAEPGDGPRSKEGMLKRKRPSPPSSPTPSKRTPREESPLPLAANGELGDVVLPDKMETILADLNVVKQRVGQRDDVTEGAVLQEQQEVAERDREGAMKVSENVSHGQVKGVSETTTDQHELSNAEIREVTDPPGSGGESQMVVNEVQESSSLAVPISRTRDDIERQHTIPSHAGWFSWTKIHTLEKRGLPEFFNGKVPGKTPELYMDYRNVIMKKYREDLDKMITVADVQEQIRDGDEKSISRVLEFLDHWGLINYQAPEEFLPEWKGPAPALEADVAGMLRALPQKGSSLYHFNTPHAPVPKQSLVDPRIADAHISEMLAFSEGPEVEYHCNSCGADCSKQRYHCQKQADFDLCPNCYNDEKFGPDMISTDFMRMDVTEAANANGGGWTDQETLLLLEALELYGDNWNEIAEHVATKSKSQCILHFIRLPVEDPFLEDMETPGVSMTAPTSTPQSQTDSTPQGDQKVEEVTDKAPESSNANVPSTETGVESSNGVVALPSSLVAFADAGNPVMAQVAFLAAMVGPRVGAHAAHAALTALTKKDPGPRLAAGTAIILEEPAAEVQPPSSAPHHDRLTERDSEMQCGGEETQLGSTEPCSEGGVAIPVLDSNASAQNDEAVHPELDSNLGKEVIQKIGDDGKLNIFEEAITAGHVKQAGASALAAAAVKAKLLADQEEREMQRLITVVIENQLKKLEVKLKAFSDIEAMLSKECESVERARQRVYTDLARPVATNLASPTRSTPVPGFQAPATAERPAFLSHEPGVLATPDSGPHSSGGPSSFQIPNPTPPAFQGLTRPMSGGTMLTPQGQLARQMMAAVATPPQLHGLPMRSQGVSPSPQLLGLPVMSQGFITPPLQLLGLPVMSQGLPPSQILGRPLTPTTNTSGDGLGMPITAPSGMSRLLPGGAAGGIPQ